jgi:hypothetical protein
MARRVLSRFMVRRLLLLAALGIGLGHLEAVAAAYMRRLLEWVPAPPEMAAQDVAAMPGWLIHAEQTREVAAIIVVFAVACLVGRNFLEKAAAFFLALGIRQIVRYVALCAMIGWPASLRATDCILLVPRPLCAPVWIPILIAVAMVAAAGGIMVVIDRYPIWAARES